MAATPSRGAFTRVSPIRRMVLDTILRGRAGLVAEVRPGAARAGRSNFGHGWPNPPGAGGLKKKLLRRQDADEGLFLTRGMVLCTEHLSTDAEANGGSEPLTQPSR
jgi:hypothetical protein